MGVILLNRAYVLESFRVPGRAMATTINHLDRIFVDKLFASAADLRRGDLVVYKAGGMDQYLSAASLPWEAIPFRCERTPCD